MRDKRLRGAILEASSADTAGNSRFKCITGSNLFLCPADAASPRGILRQSSCAGFSGGGKYRGIFAYSGRGPAELSECTDGTTQTAAVSEWLLGVGSDTNRDPHRVVFETSESLDHDHFAEACQSINPVSARLAGLPSKGSNWMRGDLGWTFLRPCAWP